MTAYQAKRLVRPATLLVLTVLSGAVTVIVRDLVHAMDQTAERWDVP